MASLKDKVVLWIINFQKYTFSTVSTILATTIDFLYWFITTTEEGHSDQVASKYWQSSGNLCKFVGYCMWKPTFITNSTWNASVTRWGFSAARMQS